MKSELRSQLKSLGADRAVLFTIIVSALGYFVDIFDLLLFSIVRVQSLKDLGITGDGLLSTGVFLINVQMAGLLAGGLIWGVLGDKFGRLSILFLSILMYSLANIANGFVTNVEQYAVLRFISGVGLAGELGLGVTLVSELLPRSVRGLGTALIASVGVLGAALAYAVADMTDWRTAYIVGGVLGLCLLVLRLGVRESGLYCKIEKKTGIARGKLWMLFGNKDALLRYIKVIAIGAPLWAMVGMFITFTPEFARDFGMTSVPTAGKAVLFCYLGLAAGDMLSGLLSQYLQSRRKAVAVSLAFLIAAVGLFTTQRDSSLDVYYGLCVLMGLGAGYWAMFVQMGAEQFGTNLRATAATSIPNVVRGLTIPITAGFHALIPTLGVTLSGVAVMAVTVMLALIALARIAETFHTDLDYTERP